MLNDDRRYFRHKVTGKADYFPAHFSDRPDFEEIDPETGSCVDCVVVLHEPQENDAVFLAPKVDTDDASTFTYSTEYDDTEED